MPIFNKKVHRSQQSGECLKLWYVGLRKNDPNLGVGGPDHEPVPCPCQTTANFGSLWSEIGGHQNIFPLMYITSDFDFFFTIFRAMVYQLCVKKTARNSQSKRHNLIYSQRNIVSKGQSEIRKIESSSAPEILLEMLWIVASK